MAIEFHIIETSFDEDRGEILVVGRMTDGILVTGMVASGGDRTGVIQEIEMLPDGASGEVFRLAFACGEESDAEQWMTDWPPDSGLSLRY